MITKSIITEIKNVEFLFTFGYNESLQKFTVKHYKFKIINQTKSLLKEETALFFNKAL